MGEDIYSEDLLGYIDKLVYTDIECDEEEVSSICTHLNHNEYCYNKLDYASRLESKTINTSSNKVIKKDYTYDNKGYLTKSVEGSTTKNYGYDNLGNLVYKDGVTLNYNGQLLRRYGSTVINYNGMYPIDEVVNGVVTKTYDWLGSKLSGVISDKSYLFSYNVRGLRERKLVKILTVTEQEF